MKLLRLSLMILLPSLLLASSPSPSRSAPESEAAVLALERDFIAAVLRSDAAALEPMLADDFHFVGTDGTVQDKAAFIAPLRSGTLKIVASEASEVTVHYSTMDVVVLTYRSADRGSYAGTEFKGDYRWSDVVVKRNGRWQFLLAQGTQIPAAK